MKTADDFARQFKLHHCIGKPSFAKQVKAIQDDACADLAAENKRLRDRLAKAESDASWDRSNRLEELMSRPEYHEMGQ